MAYPTVPTDLSTNPAANVPAGSDTGSSYGIDDMFRYIQSIIRQVYDGALQLVGGVMTGAIRFTSTGIALGTTAGSFAVDFSTHPKRTLVATGPCTLTFTFPSGVGHYQLWITGGQAIGLPTPSSTLQYVGSATAPTVSSGTYGSVLTLYNDGTNTIISVANVGSP